MLRIYGKKALIFQSLFFCLYLSGQSLEIASPRPGSPLDEPQTFVIQTTGQTPVAMTLSLNGQVIAERKSAPFQFVVNWNTTLTNRVTITATYADGNTQEIRATYEPITVDFEETASAFQCFPFPQKSMAGNALVLRSNKREITPQSLKTADPMPLDLWVVLDVSGSMHFYLEEISAPLKAATQSRASQGDLVSMMLFDATPRTMDLRALWGMTDLRRLYQERAQSSIFDALAATAIQMRGGARRLILLISDGADDGSRHTAKTVGDLLRQRQAVLCWFNPSGLRNRGLTRLVRQSGGFVLEGTAPDAFNTLLEQLKQQLHLVAPEASYPIDIRLRNGKIFYPRWPE